MKFGKISDITQVDFDLPDDPPQTAAVLQGAGDRRSPMRVYIGGTGWSTREWVGKVYPPGARTKDFLRHYARQFNTIELNTTHYRIPSPETARRWYAEAAPDFQFCPKVPQSISHAHDLGLAGAQIELFTESISLLREKLGCCFIQLPPYFGFDRIELLERFLRRWPRAIPLAVECRHESWFAAPERRRDAFGRLTALGVAAVITDVAGRRDVLHMHVTAPLTMIRFVGNGLHPSDYTRIDDWVARLRAWQALGLQHAYVFTHEPDNVLAPELAAYLLEQLKAHEDIDVRGPRLLDEGTGEQMRLF